MMPIVPQLFFLFACLGIAPLQILYMVRANDSAKEVFHALVFAGATFTVILMTLLLAGKVL